MEQGTTLKQARQYLLAELEAAGIERCEAARETELIIQHVTGLTTARQLADPEAPLNAVQMGRIAAIAEQRRRRFPLQYILGEQWFMGLPFKIRPGALIPRADTEVLVEVAVEFLKQFDKPLFADIGTGSGAIAIAALKSLPQAQCLAIDISAEALAIAAENARLNGVYDRLQLIHTGFDEFQPAQKLHAVLANPPYVPLKMAAELQPEVAVFEPKQAVFGTDEDGLGFFRSLCAHAHSHLLGGGMLAVEVGAGQAEAVEEIFRLSGWSNIRTRLDLNSIPRCISALHAVEALEK